MSFQRSNPWIKLWLTQLQFQPDHQFSHLRLRSRRAEAPRTARQCWTYWWPQFKLVRQKSMLIFCNVLSTICPALGSWMCLLLVSGRNLLEDPILGKNQWPTQQSQPNPKPKQLRVTRITNERAQTTADLILGASYTKDIYIIIIIYCCCKCCCLKRLFYLSTTLGSHTNTSVGRFRNFSNAGDLDAMENEYPEYPLHGETWEIPIAMEVSIFSMGKLHKITYEWAFGCFWKEGEPIKGQ